VVIACKDGDAEGSKTASDAKDGNKAGGPTEADLDVQPDEADDESEKSENVSNVNDDSIEAITEGGCSDNWSAGDCESEADAEGSHSGGRIYEDTSLKIAELEIPHQFFRKRLAKTEPMKV
jgi:hypothetical protein